MILVFDSETTGKADFRAPPAAPHQPRIVQLAALLLTPEFDEVAHFNLVVRRHGFRIPTEASNIHGITDEVADGIGVSLSVALDLFLELADKADHFVAHNIDFDSFILAGEIDRMQKNECTFVESFCTMKAMTPICKIPSPHREGEFKWPKLQEAHKHAFGHEFDGAHDAMADVRACARLLRWLKEGPCKTTV